MTDIPTPPEPPTWNAPPPPPPPPGDLAPPYGMAPPPGYVAYGDPGAVTRGIAGVGGISKAMVVLLAIMAALQLLGVFDTLSNIHDARALLRGDISSDEFTNRTAFGIGSAAGFLVLPVAVLTMILMFRMARNLRTIGRQGATWGPGWGIGGWFVPPVAVYVVPWLMFQELWKGSDPDRPAHDPDWKRGPVTPLIHVWWVLYGLVPILGLFTAAPSVSMFSTDATDVAKRLDDYATITVVLSVIAIGTTIVYLMLIRQLSARHMKATREN